MSLEQPNPTPAPTPTPTADDDFAAAFEQFAQPSADPPVAADPPAADPPAADPPAVDPLVAADPPAADPPVETPVATDPPAADPPVAVESPAPAPTADDILNRLDKIVSKTAAPEPAPAPAPAPAAEETPPLYSDEEQQFLQGYEKDWSDVTRGEALRRRAENAALVQFIFGEIGKVLTPLRETTETLANRTHYTDIEQKIGSYDDSLRDQMESWITTQPGYLQNAYREVIDRGTSDQVVDLVARFRKETGTAPQPAATVTGGNELSDTTKKAVASLAPVETKRSVVEHKDDPNDFEGAFSRFAEALKPK
jgi:hypothetical protein